MIEQHIFIKTGVVCETHAHSSGLNKSYIDVNLRPFYTTVDPFDPPVKGSVGYKCAFPLADGSLVVGTLLQGKKAASAIHSYVLDPTDTAAAVRDAHTFIAAPPANVLSLSSLPTLSSVPADKKASVRISDRLAALSLTPAEYLTLLAALFAAKSQNRRIFLIPDKHASLSDLLSLIEALYEYLPYYLRANIGFSTMTTDVRLCPELSLYIVSSQHVAVSREASYIDSYNAEKDYIFDFEKHVHTHVYDLKDDLAGEYLSFALRALGNGESLSDFFGFAEEAGAALSHERRLSLRFYNDLSVLYNVDAYENHIALYAGRITRTFTEIFRSGTGEHLFSAYSEFLNLYRRYIKKKGAPIPLEILKRLIGHFDFSPQTQQDELYDLLTLDLDICLKDAENDAVFTHIDAARQSNALYARIVNQKMAPSNRLITRYFTYLTEHQKTVHAIMEFTDSVFSDMPQLADHEVIQQLLFDRALLLYDTSGDRLDAVKYLEGKCRDLSDAHPEHASMFSGIYRYALENYMTSFNLSDITETQIARFPLSRAETINDDCAVKHRIVLAEKEILALCDDVAMSFVHYDAFGFENIRANLSEDAETARQAEARLKAELLRLLSEKKSSSPRRVIYTLLYYIYENHNDGKTDFDKIFSFVSDELSVPPFEFIEWFLSSRLFLPVMTRGGHIVRECGQSRPDLTVLTRFYESMRKYFLQHGELLAGERNMKKLKKELDKVGYLHPDYRSLTQQFRKVLNTILRENYSPLRRMADRIVSAKNFKFVMGFSGFIAVCAFGIFLGGKIASRNDPRPLAVPIADVPAAGANAERLSWSAVRIDREGNVSAAPCCIDGRGGAERLRFSAGEHLEISFGSERGLSINGLRIASDMPDESSAFNVFVTDNAGKRFLVNISNFDTATGEAIYAFAAPINVCSVSIEAKDAASSGEVSVKEVYAFSL